jgi:hypothetical protein
MNPVTTVKFTIRIKKALSLSHTISSETKLWTKEIKPESALYHSSSIAMIEEETVVMKINIPAKNKECRRCRNMTSKDVTIRNRRR